MRTFGYCFVGISTRSLSFRFLVANRSKYVSFSGSFFVSPFWILSISAKKKTKMGGRDGGRVIHKNPEHTRSLEEAQRHLINTVKTWHLHSAPILIPHITHHMHYLFPPQKTTKYHWHGMIKYVQDA